MTSRASQPRPSGPRVTIIVVDDDSTTGPLLETAVRGVLDDLAEVRLVGHTDDAAEVARSVHHADGIVPVLFIDGDSHGASQTAITLHDLPELEHSRCVLVTSSPSLGGVDLALRRGAVHGMITRPWTIDGLTAQLTANLATFLLEHAPDRLVDFEPILDADTRDRAAQRVAEHNAATASSTPTTPLLLDASISDDEVEQRMIQLLDRALGHPPRIRVAAGTVMIESGDDVGGIYVVLEGSVRLSSTTPTGEHILHQQSTGAIIGLLSLASHRRAMLQCRAVTDVRALPITLNQLAQALESEPELSSLLTRVLVTSLARRLRRSDELQVELDHSLSALSEARAQLVASARFAALGELAAGMAHELNNPTAALVRSAVHLKADLEQLLDDPALRSIIDRRLAETTLAPSAERALRRELVDDGIDPDLVRQLLDAGFTDPVEIRLAADRDGRDAERAVVASRLGRSFRTVVDAAGRIEELVGSLRSYVRGEDGRGAFEPGVDVTSTIENALRLVSHRIGQVEVERRFAPTPGINGRPGALQQVWTNLITNALDALGVAQPAATRSGPQAGAELTITVETIADAVHVHVIDNGPGIPPDLQDRIFEPRFTTKLGRVQFGLGLGLSISRQIIEDHGGHIAVTSKPGHTDVHVVLPTGGAS